MLILDLPGKFYTYCYSCFLFKPASSRFFLAEGDVKGKDEGAKPRMIAIERVKRVKIRCLLERVGPLFWRLSPSTVCQAG